MKTFTLLKPLLRESNKPQWLHGRTKMYNKSLELKEPS